MQEKIIWARMINAEAGWRAPYGLVQYQTVACEVQTPTEWSGLSDEDRESLDDYIKCCLTCPNEATAGEGSVKVTKLGGSTDLVEILIPAGLSDPIVASVHSAFRKIHDKALLKKITAYSKVSRTLIKFRHQMLILGSDIIAFRIGSIYSDLSVNTHRDVHIV